MLQLLDVNHAYQREPVLRGISLEIATGETLCLLGPSGCGKTTLLRVIAGLERLDSGEILLDGAPISDRPIHQRDFGLMFQEYALFPHMTVAENITFGPRMKRWSKEARQQRLEEILSLVGLSGYASRNVAELSGGQRQRVALGRSLAPRPRLLMLDEPLGALDAAMRDRLALELKTILKLSGVTTIYVTHDQMEAFAIADRITVMREGRIEQIGAPDALYRTPRTTFVARFLGFENLVPVTDVEGKLCITPLGRLPCASMSDRPAALLLHPSGITTDSSSAIQISGTITRRTFRGDYYLIEMQPEGVPDVTLTFRMSGNKPIPEIHASLIIGVDPDAILPLKASS